MRDWFSGRMTAFQAVDKGSIPLSRTIKTEHRAGGVLFLLLLDHANRKVERAELREAWTQQRTEASRGRETFEWAARKYS